MYMSSFIKTVYEIPNNFKLKKEKFVKLDSHLKKS